MSGKGRIRRYGETPMEKRMRYERKNGGPLTTKQRARLGLHDAPIELAAPPPPPPAPPVEAPNKVSVDTVLYFISRVPQATTVHVPIKARERFDAQKELDAIRSKINRHARLDGRPVATNKVVTADGAWYLKVRVEPRAA